MADHDYTMDAAREQRRRADQERDLTDHLFTKRAVRDGIRLSPATPREHGTSPLNNPAGPMVVVIACAGVTTYGFLWQGTLPATRGLDGGTTIESQGQGDSEIFRELNLYPLVIRHGEERFVVALPSDVIKRIKTATAPNP